jgi:patatin-like phospholipase/acyl hydrolase
VPNFIVKDPEKKFDRAQLTLQLQNVPASQVLNYIVDHVQAKVLYEEHAILIIAP